MQAMTMEFPVHADWVWDDLVPGAEVQAELVVEETAKDPFWLENIAIIAAPDPNRPAPVDDRFAQLGKEVPEFTLTNPLDAVFIDDRRVRHGVTPISSLLPGREAHRDVGAELRQLHGRERIAQLHAPEFRAGDQGGGGVGGPAADARGHRQVLLKGDGGALLRARR